MNVVGEIVFSNELAVQMLEYSVNRNDDWYYDTMGFYMDWKGNFLLIWRHRVYKVPKVKEIGVVEGQQLWEENQTAITLQWGIQ